MQYVTTVERKRWFLAVFGGHFLPAGNDLFAFLPLSGRRRTFAATIRDWEERNNQKNKKQALWQRRISC